MIARHQALPAGLFATGTGLSLFCTYEPQRTGTIGGMGASLTRQKSTGKFCSR